MVREKKFKTLKNWMKKKNYQKKAMLTKKDKERLKNKREDMWKGIWINIQRKKRRKL